MDENVTYNVQTSELNAENMHFIVINRLPNKANQTMKEKIEKELYKVFKKYA